MGKTIVSVLTFLGVALAGIALFWPEGKAFLEHSAVWIGWLVALAIFVLHLVGEHQNAREEKRLRQKGGDYLQRIRTLNGIILEQKREMSDKESTLQKVLDIDKFLIDRLDVTEKAIPREDE
ncbi:MAG: hypothetical protein AAF699_15620 [Pseudomonadota bacterium]